MRRRVLTVLLPILFLVLLVPGVRGTQKTSTSAVQPQELARIWDAEHVSPPLPPLLTHADLLKRLGELTAGAPGLFTRETVGESVEGRSINLIRVGSGGFHVLLWSQMHGDEPTATSALLDVFEYLRRRRDDPARQAYSLDADASCRPDAEPRRRRTVPAPQRAEHRRQSRRAAAADAGGPRAEGAPRPCPAADRLQPSQPELAHVGRRSAEAGVHLASVGRVRRGAIETTRAGR